MIQDELSEQIIGCAYKIYNTLGFGFLEKIYENAMAIEFEKLNLKFKQQHSIKVYYDEKIIGDYIADFFVENKMIIELKSTANLIKKHEVQLVNYLNATKQPVGLLINFGPEGVEIKRKYKDY